MARRNRSQIPCSVTGCPRTVVAKGMCKRHWHRNHVHGDPLAGRAQNEELIAFIERARSYDGEDCLFWPFGRAKSGYAQIWDADAKQRLYVHRIVCESNLGPPPKGSNDCCHSCNNGHLGCISRKHIRWGTRQENVQDAVASGAIKRGSDSANARLSLAQVIEIRSLSGLMSQRRMSIKFGVSPSCIQKIVERRSWAWVGTANIQ